MKRSSRNRLTPNLVFSFIIHWWNCRFHSFTFVPFVIVFAQLWCVWQKVLPDLHVKSGDNGWPFLKLFPIFAWLSLDLCTLQKYEITVIHWQNMYSCPYRVQDLIFLTAKLIYCRGSPTNAKIPHLHIHKPKTVVAETLLVFLICKRGIPCIQFLSCCF